MMPFRLMKPMHQSLTPSFFKRLVVTIAPLSFYGAHATGRLPASLCHQKIPLASQFLAKQFFVGLQLVRFATALHCITGAGLHFALWLNEAIERVAWCRPKNFKLRSK